MNKLRECPFCGDSEPRIIGGGDGRYVHCNTCGTEGPFGDYSDKQAIAAWNRRASDTFTVTPAGKAALRGEG